MSRVPGMFRRFIKYLFEAAWKLLVLPARVGTLVGTLSLLQLANEPRSLEDLASDAVQSRRSQAQIGASPTDRDLARALLRTSELPQDMQKVSRDWTPLDPSTPIVVSVLEHLIRQEGRLRRRTTTRILLELSRFRNEDEARQEIATVPRNTLSDGQRLRPTEATDDPDVTAYEWTRREDGVPAERVLQLRLRRGTAVAIMLAQTNRPEPLWESEVRSMMRIVGERLR